MPLDSYPRWMEELEFSISISDLPAVGRAAHQETLHSMDIHQFASLLAMHCCICAFSSFLIYFCVCLQLLGNAIVCDAVWNSQSWHGERGEGSEAQRARGVGQLPAVQLQASAAHGRGPFAHVARWKGQSYWYYRFVWWCSVHRDTKTQSRYSFVLMTPVCCF